MNSVIGKVFTIRFVFIAPFRIQEGAAIIDQTIQNKKARQKVRSVSVSYLSYDDPTNRIFYLKKTACASLEQLHYFHSKNAMINRQKPTGLLMTWEASYKGL